ALAVLLPPTNALANALSPVMRLLPARIVRPPPALTLPLLPWPMAVAMPPDPVSLVPPVAYADEVTANPVPSAVAVAAPPEDRVAPLDASPLSPPVASAVTLTVLTPVRWMTAVAAPPAPAMPARYCVLPPLPPEALTVPVSTPLWVALVVSS